MRRTIVTTSATALAVLALAAPAAAQDASQGGAVFTGQMSEVADNDPGDPTGSGRIEVAEDGTTMTITLDAEGLTDLPHAMHLHGIVEGDEVRASSCPTAELDADGDGVVNTAEGVPAYGTVQFSLTTTGDTSPDSALAVDRFPAGTSITYSRAGIPIPDTLQGNLDKVHFVIHGVDEDGNGELTSDQEERSSLDESLPREATLPALCGTLVAAGGRVDTGDGSSLAGTSDDVTPAALGLTGLAAAVAAAAVLRRPRADAATS